MIEKEKEKSETITFCIDKELKKQFQIKLIQKNSSITEKITEWIKEYTK